MCQFKTAKVNQPMMINSTRIQGMLLHTYDEISDVLGGGFCSGFRWRYEGRFDFLLAPNRFKDLSPNPLRHAILGTYSQLRYPYLKSTSASPMNPIALCQMTMSY